MPDIVAQAAAPNPGVAPRGGPTKCDDRPGARVRRASGNDPGGLPQYPRFGISPGCPRLLLGEGCQVIDGIDEEVRRVVASHGRLSVDVAGVGAQDNLFRLGMTSHATLNVMLALEEAFDIEFPEELLEGPILSPFRRSKTLISGLVGPTADSVTQTEVAVVGLGPWGLATVERLVTVAGRRADAPRDPRDRTGCSRRRDLLRRRSRLPASQHALRPTRDVPEHGRRRGTALREEPLHLGA